MDYLQNGQENDKKKKYYFILLFLLVFNSHFLGRSSGASMDTNAIFNRMGFPQFSEVFEPSDIDEWDGQDTMVRVRGKFLAENEEKILQLLKAENFQIVEDMIFITGNNDIWWKINGPVLSERNFVRSEVGENVFLKLIVLSSGERLFFVEQTGF